MKQLIGGIEIMSNGDLERQRDRETHETEETQDVPPLAASVKTLQDAVQLSLKHGLARNTLFNFSRALRAFEITHNRRLSPNDLESAFSLWCSTAKPEGDSTEWRFLFLDTFQRTKVPLGANPLDEAIRRANASPPPPEAEHYKSPGLRRLISACFQLGQISGDGKFFLSVRGAARIFGTKDRNESSAMLAGLVRDGILTEIRKGKSGGTKATRFRYNSGQ